MKITIESTEHEEYRVGYHRIINIFVASDDLTADDMITELMVPAMVAYGFQEKSIHEALAGYAEDLEYDRVLDEGEKTINEKRAEQGLGPLVDMMTIEHGHFDADTNWVPDDDQIKMGMKDINGD